MSSLVEMALYIIFGVACADCSLLVLKEKSRTVVRKEAPTPLAGLTILFVQAGMYVYNYFAGSVPC